MNDLQKELQELKAKVADLESRIVAKPVANWQPEGGEYLIMSNGETVEASQTSINDTMAKLFGTRRDTQEQAQRVSIEMRRFNRLLALRDELCEGQMNWEDKNSKKYYVYFDNSNERWDWTFDGFLQKITPYFTTQQSVQKACDLLNSGEVEL